MTRRTCNLKPVFYLGGACLSLLTLSHYVDPILQLKERGIWPAVSSNLAGKSSGIDLEALESMVNGVGTDGSDSMSQKPREIVVIDVRTINGPDVAVRDQVAQGVTLQNQRRWDEAEAVYLEILKTETRHTAVHRNLAVLYCQTQRYEKAWSHVLALERLGRSMPAGFLEILEASMPDPRAVTADAVDG